MKREHKGEECIYAKMLSTLLSLYCLRGISLGQVLKNDQYIVYITLTSYAVVVYPLLDLEPDFLVSDAVFRSN